MQQLCEEEREEEGEERNGKMNLILLILQIQTYIQTKEEN